MINISCNQSDTCELGTYYTSEPALQEPRIINEHISKETSPKYVLQSKPCQKIMNNNLQNAYNTILFQLTVLHIRDTYQAIKGFR